MLSKFTLIIGSFAVYFKPQTIERLLREIEFGNMHNMDLYMLRKKLGSVSWDSPYIIYKCGVYKTEKIESDFFNKYSGRYYISSLEEYSVKMYYNLTSNYDKFFLKTFNATIGSFKDEIAEKSILSLYEKMPDNPHIHICSA